MTGSVPKGLRQRRKQETRARLYEAALALIEAKGYESVSVAEICDAAGTAKGTFFNYFQSKADVIAAWYLETIDFERDVKSDGLKATLDQIVDLTFERLARSPALFAAKTSEEGSSDAIAAAEREVDARLRALLSTALEREGFDIPGERTDICDLLLALMTGAARQWRYASDDVPVDSFVRTRLHTALALLQRR